MPEPAPVTITLRLPTPALSMSFLLSVVCWRDHTARRRAVDLSVRYLTVTTGGVEVVPILQLPNPSLMMTSNPLMLLQSAFATSGPNVPMVPPVSENPNLIGYRAVSSIKVAVRNVSRAGEVVDIVSRAGAIPNGSIRYLLRDEETLERTLLEEAIGRAREKAKVLAAAAGRSTGSPISISEEVTAFQPQQFFGSGRPNPFSMPPAGNTVRPPFLSGQLTFCARVSVVYQLQ